MSSPWTRPRDRIIAGAIVIFVALAGVLVWVGSDSRATDHATAAGAKPLAEPQQPPETLTELWRAPSAATAEPVTGGASVVTGDGGKVSGRDAETGETAWHYERDLQLCTVTSAWSSALAVYRNDAGCGEVTKLAADTGKRTGQRTGELAADAHVITDGSHVVTVDSRLLNVWGENLVRSMEYGWISAPVEPNLQPKPGCKPRASSTDSETSVPAPARCRTPIERQPREGCTFTSTTTAAARIATVETCRGEESEWLTVIGTTNNDSGRADEPVVALSAELPGKDAQVVAVGHGDKPRVAIALPHTGRLLVYGEDGTIDKEYRLEQPADELLESQPARTPVLTSTDASLLWFTGTATIALDRETLQPHWTLPDTRGSAVRWANATLVPIDGGLALIDEQSGKPSRTVSVDRAGFDGVVRLGAVGPVLLEQRGETLVALGQG